MEEYKEVVKTKKIIITILVIFLVLFIPQLVFAADSSPSFEVTFVDEEITASAGNLGHVTLNLNAGQGGTVEGIKITAASSNWEIKPEGEWTKNVGNLYSGSSTSIIFNFMVSSAASPGLYEVSFKVTSTNAGLVTRYAVIKVEESDVLDIISLSPFSLDIGKKTTLNLNISNNGNVDIENILLSWEDEYNYILPIGTDNRIKIKSIPANNTSEIPFEVFVSPSLPAGVYPLFISLEFYDQTGSKQTINSEIGVQIGGLTDFEIVVQESVAGSSTFAVANTGANIASSVIVSIPRQINYATSGISSVSLGNLEAGDYTLATFQISSIATDNNTQGSNFDRTSMDNPPDFTNMKDFKNRTIDRTGGSNLIVEISYTDLFGIRQIVQKEVELTTTSSSNNLLSRFAAGQGGNMPGAQNSDSGLFDNGTTYIIIGVVGILLIIVIVKFEKIKKISMGMINKKGRKE